MKTPRDILLAQTRHCDPQLETIQRAVIADTLPNGAKRMECERLAAALRHSLKDSLWLEIFLPARRIWLCYAFIWIAIAAFHFTISDHTKPQLAKTTNTSEAIANWKEQQIILTELTKPMSHDPVDRPKQQPMSPRSEARTIAIG